MSQEFLVETFVWQPGMKKKEHRFDTLAAAQSFAEENAPHFHIIKVWNENGKNVTTKRTLATLAEDPTGAHTEHLFAAKTFAQKGEANPRFAADPEAHAANVQRLTSHLIANVTPLAAFITPAEPLAMEELPMPEPSNTDIPLVPGPDPVQPPDTMPQ